jgi:NADPH:quinone reductase-like Zn-dependent oxidoreductase
MLLLRNQNQNKIHNRNQNKPKTKQIADLVAAGKVKLTVALKVPIAEVAKAHDQIATGHTRGKCVLTF